MKIKTFLVIGALLMLAICIAGCDEETPTTSPSKAFLGGQAGLKAEFVNGMPPDDILDNNKETFGIGLKLENMGEADILKNEGYVEIVGINAKDFGKNSQNDLKSNFKDDIKGAKKTYQGERVSGGQTIVEFSGLRYKQDLPGETTLPITADLCYNFKTRAATKICVKKNLLDDISDDKICKISGDKDVENSGSPIQITSLKQNPIGEGKIQLLFTIAHVGDPADSFFKTNAVCDDKEANPERYQVYFKVLTEVNGKKPQCSGLDTTDDASQGYITLFNKGERQLSCTLDISSVDTMFEKVIDIELQYRYMQSLKKEITVKDVS